MALPKLDAFTGTDGTELATYDANWVPNALASTLVINTNGVCPNGAAAAHFYHWEGDTFDNDQYSQIVIKANGAAWFGPAVRAAGGATETGYGCYGSTAGVMTFAIVSGVFTFYGWSSTLFSVDEVIRMEVSGSSCVVKRNGVIDTGLSFTDTSITSGYAGLVSHAAGTTSRGDDWEGGNLNVAAGQPLSKRFGGLQHVGWRRASGSRMW